MIASIGRERILRAFLDGSVPEFQRSFEKSDITSEDIASRFGVRNFFSAVFESAHWARWRAVGIEHRLAGGGVDRRIGFDLDVGNSGGLVRLRYFPRIQMRRNDYPVQFASLYVHGGSRDHQNEVERLYNENAEIKSVEIIGRSVKFRGSIPDGRGRVFPALWIEPHPETTGNFRFRLGERLIPVGKGRPRRGFSDVVMFPGLDVEPEFPDMEFVQAPADNFA